MPEWGGSFARRGEIEPEHRENVAKLMSCERPHDFVSIRSPGQGASRGRYRCAKCGGEMNDRAVWNYREGLRDGLRAAERHYKAEAARLVAEAAPAPARNAEGWGGGG